MNLRGVGCLGLISICLSLVGCGADSPLATNPINDNVSAVRTAKPPGQKLSQLEKGKTAISKSLVATFIVDPEQLKGAAQDEIALTPQTVTLTTSDGKAKGLGTYTPNDFSLQLKGRIPDANPVGSAEFNVRFLLKTTTLLLAPGADARLSISQAALQDPGQPQRLSPALQLPPPLDYPSKEITKGQSSTRAMSLNFGAADWKPRSLRLEVTLTSPIPPLPTAVKIELPPSGSFYHAVSLDPSQPFSTEALQVYTQVAGKSVAWVETAQNWSQSKAFPLSTATAIRLAGSAPYLRVMLPAGEALQRIREGKEEADWQAWGAAIKSFGSPVIVELIADPSSPADQVQAAYRAVIALERRQNLPNLTWVVAADPKRYPGDEWADWIRVDLDGTKPLAAQLEAASQQTTAVSATRPWVVGLAATSDPAQSGLKDLVGKSWPRLVGVVWPGNGAGWATAFKQQLGSAEQIVGQLITTASEAKASPDPKSSPGIVVSPDPKGSPGVMVSPDPKGSL